MYEQERMQNGHVDGTSHTTVCILIQRPYSSDILVQIYIEPETVHFCKLS